MISGPLSLRLVGALLGKTETGLRTLMEEDGLPVLRVPGEKRMVVKIYFSPLLAWINAQAGGQAMTEEQLEAELLRCQRALDRADKAKQKRREETNTKKGEPCYVRPRE